jgi:hypothetical protein
MHPSLPRLRSSILVALGLPLLGCGSETVVTPELRACSDSTPIPEQPELERCAEGFVHRPSPAACTSRLPRADVCEPSFPDDPVECTTDLDCTDAAHGQCGVYDQIVQCRCQYGCISDDDCGSGAVCNCGDPAGRCAASTCATDADCGEGLCIATRLDDCGSVRGFACQLAGDACSSDGDCDSGQLCTYSEAGRRCLVDNCPVPGRPFLVEGEARIAAVTRRNDWLASIEPELATLGAAERAELAEYFTRAGQMEHASIAAFARFAMQLVGLGAPADLVADAGAAMIDETRHAKICFALASSYADQPLGPGALELDGASRKADLLEVVLLTFREGCVGESSAAHEARRMAEAVVDPSLRAVLERIADDEERHAVLAWRFVAWALASCGAELATELGRELDGLAHSELPARLTRISSRSGVPSEAERRALRTEAIAAVVLPCARALLEPFAEGDPGAAAAVSRGPSAHASAQRAAHVRA